MRRYFKSEDGFTLIELVASITIISITLLPLFALFYHGKDITEKFNNQKIALWLAQEYIEREKISPLPDTQNIHIERTRWMVIRDLSLFKGHKKVRIKVLKKDRIYAEIVTLKQ